MLKVVILSVTRGEHRLLFNVVIIFSVDEFSLCSASCPGEKAAGGITLRFGTALTGEGWRTI